MTTGRINQVAADWFFRCRGRRLPPREEEARPLGREVFRANLRCSAKGALLQSFGGVSNRAALLEFRNCSVPRNRAGAGAQQAPPVAGFAAPVLRSITSKPPETQISHQSQSAQPRCGEKLGEWPVLRVRVTQPQQRRVYGGLESNH